MPTVPSAAASARREFAACPTLRTCMRPVVTMLCLLCCPPEQDLIVSNSEDKSLRVWDMSKRIGVQVGVARVRCRGGS